MRILFTIIGVMVTVILGIVVIAAVSSNGDSGNASVTTSDESKPLIVIEGTSETPANVSLNVGFDITENRVIQANETYRYELRSDQDPSGIMFTVSPVEATLDLPPASCKITVDGVTVAENINGFMAVC
jgi:hypothetical protein